MEGGSANDYDYCNADPVNCTDLSGEYAYSLNWKIGPGDSAAAEALMATVMASPDQFFPFTVPGAITLGGTLELTAESNSPGTVTVSGVGSNWFSFRTHGGHVEGKNATVMFSIYSEKGQLYFQVDANGPDGRLQKCRVICRPIRGVSNAYRTHVGRVLWSHMALNLRNHHG